MNLTISCRNKKKSSIPTITTLETDILKTFSVCLSIRFFPEIKQPRQTSLLDRSVNTFWATYCIFWVAHYVLACFCCCLYLKPPGDTHRQYISCVFKSIAGSFIYTNNWDCAKKAIFTFYQVGEKLLFQHAGQPKLLLYARNDPFSNPNVLIYLAHNIRPLGCNLYADSLLVLQSDESHHNHQGLRRPRLGSYGSSLNKHSTPHHTKFCINKKQVKCKCTQTLNVKLEQWDGCKNTG